MHTEFPDLHDSDAPEQGGSSVGSELIMAKKIPEDETPLQRKIRENRHLTDNVVAGIEAKKNTSSEAMDKQREVLAEEEKKSMIAASEAEVTRVYSKVDPNDLRLSGIGNTPEVVVENRPDLGDKVEKRDFGEYKRRKMLE